MSGKIALSSHSVEAATQTIRELFGYFKPLEAQFLDTTVKKDPAYQR